MTSVLNVYTNLSRERPQGVKVVPQIRRDFRTVLLFLEGPLVHLYSSLE